MSALVGGGATNTKNVIKYSSLQVSTSQLDIPVTLFWGQRRISPNCIWYNDFQSHKANAGKGGGKGNEYTYSAAVMLALGEGIMSQPLNVWGPSSTTTTTTLSALGLSLFTGTAMQSVWSWLQSQYPAQAQAYMDTAYVASSNLNLGESASVPDYAFEMQRLNGFGNILTAPGWTNPTTHAVTQGSDVSFADVIPDFLTNPVYGMGLSLTDLGDMTAFAAYQSAQGIYVSPCLTAQEKATDILARWATIANSWIYWSGTAIQFVPLGDSALSGNGFTYTPDLAPAYALGPGDILDAIEVTRQDPADCYNRTVLEICDRTRGYVSSPVEYKDPFLVAEYGLRDNSSTQANEICNPAVGAICAQLIGKRAAYIRNTYKFKTSYRCILLLPGSIVTLSDPHIGLTNFPVRIRSIAEDEGGVLSFVVEELPSGIGTYFSLNTPPVSVATTVNTNAAPGPVNIPAVCEPASSFGAPSILIAASGGPYWGGANVFLSLDGVEYSQIGTLTKAALQATLTAPLAAFPGPNPDIADTLAVDATPSGGVFPSVGVANAQNYTSLCWVAPVPVASGGDEVLSAQGELLAFGAVAPSGTFTANLSWLERGLYGTGAIAHGAGSQLTLFDTTGRLGSTLIYALAPRYIGKTLYLQFQSFNVFGQAEQSLSECAVYTYTPTGASYGSAGAGTPSQPTGFGGIVTSSQVFLSWNANPATDNVTAYAVYRASGTSAPFSAAALIWAGDALSFTDSSVNLVSGYTYYLVAINAVGESSPGAGFEASTAGINNGQVLQSGDLAAAAELDIDFNPQVLACGFLEIDLWNLQLGSNGASVAMGLRHAGAYITGVSYFYTGTGSDSNGSSGVHGSQTNSFPLTAASSNTDSGVVSMRLWVGGAANTFKIQFVSCMQTTGDADFNVYQMCALSSSGLTVTPTGMAFKATTGTLALSYAIKGFVTA